MKISNRGQLIHLINNWGVETNPVDSKPGTNIYHTIIYDKKKDKYYRIEWGEVADADKVYHLWYNDEAVEVQFNKSRWKNGWFTKKEVKKIDAEETQKRGLLNMDNFLLHNVENNLVNINEIENSNFNKIQLIGGKTGKGKTWYSVNKAIEAMKDGKTVLFFPIESTAEEIIRRMKKILADTRALSWITEKRFKNEQDKDKFIDDFIKNSNLIINENYLIDDNYIVSTMRKQSKTEEGLDFVIIDGIHLVLDNTELNNYKDFERIQNLLEDVSHELKCQTLITTQINRNM